MIPPVELSTVVLIALFAATVNGALGHGFSSITVPVALLFFPNRILSPALVPLELAINLWMLFISRNAIRVVFKRVLPLLLGLLPGVFLGTYLLSAIRPEGLKFFTFLGLAPLILMQAAGLRRPIRDERRFGIPFGAGVGLLYSTTTISGPPLALLFNNQGFVKNEFRAALGLIRLAESSLTAAAYYFMGLYTVESTHLFGWFIPSALVGIPAGVALVGRVEPETFRRVCMSFDAWVVGFGLSRVIIEIGLLRSPIAYSVWIAVIVVDTYLLYMFFLQRRLAQEVSVAKRIR